MARKSRREKRKKVSGRKRSESHGSGFSSKCYNVPDGVRVFMADKEGVRKLDIIPYEVPDNSRGAANKWAEPGDLHFERTFFVHRDVGIDGDMYPCLKKTFKKPCPICDFRGNLMKDPDADEDLVKALAPKERQLWNVIERGEDDETVKLWDFSYHLFGKQLDARIKNSDEDDGYEFFADPDDGQMLKVGFEEKQIGTNTFYSAETIDFKPRREELTDEELDAALVLDDILIEYEYEQLREIFLQTKDDDSSVREPEKSESESDQDDQPPKREKKPARNAEEPSEEKKSSDTTTSDASPSKRRRRAPKEDAKEEAPKKTYKDFGLETQMPVDHPKHGECVIIAFSDDGTEVHILDPDDQKQTVGPETLTIAEWEDDEPEAKTDNKPKKEEPKEEPAAVAAEDDDADNSDWDDDWDD